MRVLVAGAGGSTGRLLVGRLATRGHEARAMVRDADQGPALEALGAQVVVADLEGEVGPAVDGVEAIVFAAGAGPGSGAAKKRTVDLGGAAALIEAAAERGVRRYAMLSSMRADDPESGPEAMRPYLWAKHEADERLAASGLDFTIVRAGRLTDEGGSGLVDAAPKLNRAGEIPRDDVAAVLAAVLESPNTIGKTFELLAGDTPVDDALAAL